MAALLLRELSGRMGETGFRQAIPGELHRLQEYIRSHLDRPLRVAGLARTFGVSVASLERLFRNYANCTPSHWIAKVGCEKAKHLLGTTGLAVGEVGERVGMGDPFHFSRFFKRMEGLPPIEYQRGRGFL